MNLPLNSPDGQLMSYKLHHRRTGSQLLDSQTLQQANVLNGDEVPAAAGDHRRGGECVLLLVFIRRHAAYHVHQSAGGALREAGGD